MSRSYFFKKIPKLSQKSSWTEKSRCQMHQDSCLYHFLICFFCGSYFDLHKAIVAKTNLKVHWTNFPTTTVNIAYTQDLLWILGLKYNLQPSPFINIKSVRNIAQKYENTQVLSFSFWIKFSFLERINRGTAGLLGSNHYFQPKISSLETRLHF